MTENQRIALNYLDAVDANAIRWSPDDMWYWRNDIRCHTAIADAFVHHMRQNPRFSLTRFEQAAGADEVYRVDN